MADFGVQDDFMNQGLPGGALPKPVEVSGHTEAGQEVKKNPETQEVEEIKKLAEPIIKSGLQATTPPHQPKFAGGGTVIVPDHGTREKTLEQLIGDLPEAKVVSLLHQQTLDEKEQDVMGSSSLEKETLISTLIQAPKVHFISLELESFDEKDKEFIQNIFNKAVQVARSTTTGKSTVTTAGETVKGDIDREELNIEQFLLPSCRRLVLITRGQEVGIVDPKEKVGEGSFKRAIAISTIISSILDDIAKVAENIKNVLLLSNQNLSEDEKKAWIEECELSQHLNKLGVPHIAVYDASKSPTTRWEVSAAIAEYKEGGTVYDRYFTEATPYKLGDVKPESLKFAKNDFNVIAETSMETLSAMHENDFYHNDIKPNQFLINKVRTDKPLQKKDVLLGDFGLIIKGKDHELKPRGTPFYRAPELLIENVKKWCFNGKEDCFSLGMMFLELPDCPGDMIADKHSKFTNCNEAQSLDPVDYKNLLAELSKNLIDNGSPREQLIGHLIDPNRDTRWDMKTAFKFLQENVLPPKTVVT